MDGLLKEIDYPDKTIIAQLLAGGHPVYNIFATKVPDMRISEIDLPRAGKCVKPKMKVLAGPLGNLDADRAAWMETLEERDASWLAVPSRLPNWTPNSLGDGSLQSLLHCSRETSLGFETTTQRHLPTRLSQRLKVYHWTMSRDCTGGEVSHDAGQEQ